MKMIELLLYLLATTIVRNWCFMQSLKEESSDRLFLVEFYIVKMTIHDCVLYDIMK